MNNDHCCEQQKTLRNIMIKLFGVQVSTTWIVVPCRLIKRSKLYEKQPLINIIIIPLNCHAFSIQETIKVLVNVLFSRNTLEFTYTMLMSICF